MLTPALASVFEATVLLSTAAALGLGFWSVRPRSMGHSKGVPGPFAHPLVQFGIVCFVIWLNQLLFGAYVVRAHHGSPAFIARFIGGGWFAIDAQSPFVQFIAAHAGDGRWLSPSVLRVQAFLELPFTLFAYLSVARMLGSDLYRRLTSLPALFLASISWTVTFSLVELSLPNPYTNDDVILRAIAMIVVPLYIARISRTPSARTVDDGPTGVLGLLAFLAGAGAISYVVLALYDAFLLYNLAHFSRYAGGIVVATAIAALASVAAPRVDALLAKSRGALAEPSPAVDACVSSLRIFTLLFFVPSLALRYRGHMPSSVLCGLVVVGIALLAGIGRVVRRILEDDSRAFGTFVTLGVSGGAALAAGTWAAWLALASSGYTAMPELLLAKVALSFLVASIVTFRAVEIAVCWTRHEAKAQADEA